MQHHQKVTVRAECLYIDIMPGLFELLYLNYYDLYHSTCITLYVPFLKLRTIIIIIIIIKIFSKNVSKAASSSQDNAEWWNKLRVKYIIKWITRQ